MCGHLCIGFIDFMLAGKKLTGLQICFLLMILKKKWQYNFELFQRWMEAILSKQI